MSQSMTNEKTAFATSVNGVDIETLMGTVNAIRNEPQIPLNAVDSPSRALNAHMAAAN